MMSIEEEEQQPPRNSTPLKAGGERVNKRAAAPPALVEEDDDRLAIPNREPRPKGYYSKDDKAETGRMEEDMLRYHANQMEVHACHFMEETQRRARAMEEGVEVDAAKCKDAARALSREAERCREAIQDSANVMMSMVQREAVAMRQQAAFRWDDLMAEV